MKSFQEYLNEIGEIGYVDEILDSLVHVSGIPKARYQEIILFETGEKGLVFSLKREYCEVLLFTQNSLRSGVRAVRTNTLLTIPVGEQLLGNTIDPLGYSLDHATPFVKPEEESPLFIAPLGISQRKRIEKQLQTGNSLVDLLVPLGKGQRELIIGDRKTGKTNFLLQAILTQARQKTLCLYVAIGKKKIDIKKTEEFFIKYGIRDKTIIIATSSHEPAGMIFLTPYAAMAIAEHFRDHGHDVIVVFDDLTAHAKYYREISLLAREFPGRNSYPGDMFYTHARLLERAGNFVHETGQVSITALPVAETTEGDLSGYIQTNLMSMTDGHIYFDSDLFKKGRRPAINPFLSVTRVGRQTQSAVEREINRELISFLTLLDRTERFVHFGAELSQTLKNTLSMGQKIIAFFYYSSERLVSGNLQVFLFCLLWSGLWQDASSKDMISDMDTMIHLYQTNENLVVEIEKLVGKAKSFNELLGIINKNRNYYEELIKKGK